MVEEGIRGKIKLKAKKIDLIINCESKASWSDEDHLIKLKFTISATFCWLIVVIAGLLMFLFESYVSLEVPYYYSKYIFYWLKVELKYNSSL